MNTAREFRSLTISLLLATVWLPREASAAQCGSTAPGFETAAGRRGHGRYPEGPPLGNGASGPAPRRNRTHSLRKRKQTVKAWCGRAEAPEREPRSTARLPAVKPPSVLVPCGLRARKRAGRGRACARTDGRYPGRPPRRNRASGPARAPMPPGPVAGPVQPSAPKDQRQRPPGAESGPRAPSGGLSYVTRSWRC
jgi:hypothetical protein